MTGIVYHRKGTKAGATGTAGAPTIPTSTAPEIEAEE